MRSRRSIVQLCRDQIASAVAAQGATPVFVPTNFPISPARAIDPQLLLAARDAGAKAMLVVTVAVASSNVSQGMSIGIGGFGFGSSGGGGIGVSAPVGGGSVTQGYAANGRLTDVASERLLWTAKATSPRVERRQRADERALEDAVRRGDQGRRVLSRGGTAARSATSALDALAPLRRAGQQPQAAEKKQIGLRLGHRRRCCRESRRRRTAWCGS